MDDEQWRATWAERNTLTAQVMFLSPGGVAWQAAAARLDELHEQRRAWLLVNGVWNEPCFAAWRDTQAASHG